MIPEGATTLPRPPHFARELFSGAKWVFVAFIVSRVIIFATIGLSRMIMVRADRWHPGGIMSVLTQWDGDLWYLSIARRGYDFTQGGLAPFPFFPLYPMLVKLVSLVFRDMRVASLLTSHVCLLVAGLLLHVLVRMDYKDPRVSRVAVMFLMFSPVSFFFSSAYTESTFLMLALGSFLAARNGKWLIACLLGMCLSATRNVGVLITLPLVIEYVRQTWRPGESMRVLFHPRILLFGIVPLGIGSYMLYTFLKFNNALAFVHASEAWGRQFTSPIETLSSFQTYEPFYQWFFMGAMVTAVLLWAAGIFLKIRASYLVFAALLTATYLCAKTMEAWPRYLSVEFPLFLVLGLLAARWRWSYEPLLAASIALLTLCTILSANGYWIT